MTLIRCLPPDPLDERLGPVDDGGEEFVFDRDRVHRRGEFLVFGPALGVGAGHEAPLADECFDLGGIETLDEFLGEGAAGLADGGDEGGDELAEFLGILFDLPAGDVLIARHEAGHGFVEFDRAPDLGARGHGLPGVPRELIEAASDTGDDGEEFQRADRVEGEFLAGSEFRGDGLGRGLGPASFAFENEARSLELF